MGLVQNIVPKNARVLGKAASVKSGAWCSPGFRPFTVDGVFSDGRVGAQRRERATPSLRRRSGPPSHAHGSLAGARGRECGAIPAPPPTWTPFHEIYPATGPREGSSFPDRDLPRARLHASTEWALLGKVDVFQESAQQLWP
jgi:hypothetical protein